ncbi:hypothetical protein QQ045_029411 [Rhodiola kirilowii]
MATPRFGFTFKPRISLFNPFPNLFRKGRSCVLASLKKADDPEDFSQLSIKELESSKTLTVGDEQVKWKKVSSKVLGVSTSSIAQPIRVVLNGLKRKGHKVYLVGGCVRDLVLKRTPKDFDIITTAELKEVLRIFSHSHIVGKRFPICLVHVNDSVIEVFTTFIEFNHVCILDSQVITYSSYCVLACILHSVLSSLSRYPALVQMQELGMKYPWILTWKINFDGETVCSVISQLMGCSSISNHESLAIALCE